jgi:hypothetical protein
MKKAVLLILLFAIVAVTLQAQEEIPSRKGKIFLIPELWLSFGTRTYIEVAPMIGYHVNNRLSIGLGPHYIYQSQKAIPPYPSYDSHAYGLKGFARFSIITNAEEFLPIKLFSDLFVHVEYEGLSLERELYVPPYIEAGRFIYQGFLVGGGFSQRVGMYNSVSFMVLWDVNESSYSPYSNPIFRVGFNAFL